LEPLLAKKGPAPSGGQDRRGEGAATHKDVAPKKPENASRTARVFQSQETVEEQRVGWWYRDRYIPGQSVFNNRRKRKCSFKVFTRNKKEASDRINELNSKKQWGRKVGWRTEEGGDYQKKHQNRTKNRPNSIQNLGNSGNQARRTRGNRKAKQPNRGYI